ncbi:MAG: phage tail protein, partial [Agrobacterium vaccinii]
MADLAYAHGVTLNESAVTPSLLRVQRQGITFVNGTAPDADAATIPLNYPTLVTSVAAAALLGASGTLLEDVTTVFGEGGSWCIVNRVAHDADAAVLQSNLIGDPVARTGLYSA